MTFRIYSCRVITPLYKIPKTLKLNDIYRFELVKFMYKLHHGALPKIYDKFFQSISCVHSYQTRFANNQNYLIRRVYKNSEKKTMFQRDCTLDRNRTEPCPMTSSAYSIEIVSSRIMNKFVFIFNMFGYMPFCGYCICLLQEREAFFFLFFLFFCQFCVLLIVFLRRDACRVFVHDGAVFDLKRFGIARLDKVKVSSTSWLLVYSSSVCFRFTVMYHDK